MWKNIGVCGEIRYREGLASVVIGVMTFRAGSRITNLVDVDGTRLVQNTIPRVQSWCQNCAKIFERGHQNWVGRSTEDFVHGRVWEKKG